MSEYSKGPWYALKDNKPHNHGGWVISQQPQGGATWIAEILGGLRDSRQEANARLIARAPSMLALLEKALPIIEEEAERRSAFPSEDEEEGNYWLEMRSLADAISAEIDRARGKEVKSDVD